MPTDRETKREVKVLSIETGRWFRLVNAGLILSSEFVSAALTLTATAQLWYSRISAGPKENISWGKVRSSSGGGAEDETLGVHSARWCFLQTVCGHERGPGVIFGQLPVPVHFPQWFVYVWQCLIWRFHYADETLVTPIVSYKQQLDVTGYGFTGSVLLVFCHLLHLK